MKEKTDKLITLVCLCLAIIGSVFAILFAMKGNEALFNTAFWMLITFICISGLAILLFLVLRIVRGKGWKFLIGLGLIVLIVAVAFALSKGTDLTDAWLGRVLEFNPSTDKEKLEAAHGVSKFVGTACITTYITCGLAVLAIICTPFIKLIKK